MENIDSRRRRKKAILIAAWMMLLLCPISLAGPSGDAWGWRRAWASRMYIEDGRGKTVDIALPVKSLVVLNSDVLEVIRALDAGSLVKGVFSGIERDRSLWPALVTRPKVGSWRDPSAEIIAELNPDLVIGYSRNPGPGFDRKMASLGIQVLRLDFYKIRTLEKEVQTLGRILNREGAAEKLCAWYRKVLDIIRKRLENRVKMPDVYIESYSDFHMTGPGSGGDEMCALAGGHNIASGFSIPYPQVTPEWVVARNPEVIIKAVSRSKGYEMNDPSFLNQKRLAITGRPAWKYIRAVKTGNIHVMESAIWAGPRAVIGIAYMAKWFHPDLFKDLDPEALHKEYLKTFQGVEYRGVFVSSPVETGGR